MKNLVFIFAAFAAMVIVSCKNEAFENENGLKQIVGYVPVDSTHVDLVDEDGTPVVKNFFAVYASLEAEAVKYADADDAWRNSEALDKSVEETEVGKVTFKYNLGDNELQYSVRKVIYGEKLVPMFKPSLSVKARSMRVNEDPRNGRYYAETTTVYDFCYHGKVVMASATQPFVAEEGYVPSFERMFWNSNHNLGTAKATYANAKVTIECTDSLRAWERWDDASLKNWLRTIYHSQDVLSTTISGTEVTSISAVVNKDMSISGNKATIAEFSVEFNLISKTIKESRINYTYNNKSINFVDSLTACEYKLKGAKLTSKTNLHVVFTHEGDDVAVDIPVNITEKVTLKEILRNYIHKAFRKVASVSGSIITVICDNNGEMTKVFSNNTKEKSDIPYTWTFKFTYNVPSGLTTDVIGHTYNFNNGSTSVEGKDVTVTFSSSSISDIMFEGQNYKSEAPQCSVEVKAITFNSKTQATVTFNGEGENVTAQVPVNLTEKPYTFDGHLNHLWCTMSLIDGSNGVATIDGVYLMGDVTLKDGRSFAAAKKYGNMTNDGTITVTYNPEEAWDMVELNTEQLNRISNNHPLAWTGKTPKAKWGYINLDEVHMISQGNYEITYYNLLTGNESRNVCATGATIDSKYPYPVVGTWKDGKITIAGRTLYVNGSEN